MALELDLNNLPPMENDHFQMSNGVDVVNTTLELRVSHVDETIDLEHIDDEVVICSRRSFLEAREKARIRNRGVKKLLPNEHEPQGVHSGTLSYRDDPLGRMPTKRRIGGHDVSPCLDGHDIAESENVVMTQVPAQSLPNKKRLTLTCPICMTEVTEETSTKCGHIFCKNCINDALVTQRKCPACRRKLRLNDTFRIYLPTGA